MKILLSLLAISFSSALLYGQSGLLKTIGGAAKNKVEQQDFNSTRTNKEKLDDADRPKTSPAPAPSRSSEPAESAVDSTETPVMPEGGKGGYEPSYTFSQKITYEMQDLKKSKSEKVSMTHFYSDGAIMSVTGEAEMNMIFDFTHESMIMLNEKEMTAIVMSSAIGAAMANKEVEASGTPTIVKTGKTKKILGYNCVEYLISDEKHTSNCWVTSEIGIDATKAAKAMGVPQTSNSLGEDGKGIMMEFTSYDKKGVAETHMIMTEYKEEATTKSLSAYTVTVL